MRTDRSKIGLAAIAFPVLTLLAFVVANPPGGNYDADVLADFVARGHRTRVYIALYLLLLAGAALLYLVAALRAWAGEGSASGRLFSATGFAAGTAWAVGAPLIFVVPVGLANGGHPLSDQGVVYMFTQAGYGVIFGAGGVMLAIALLAFASAAGAALPTWLRGFTLAAGVLGLASLAFFPFFVLLIWGLAFGIWALAARNREPAAT